MRRLSASLAVLVALVGCGKDKPAPKDTVPRIAEDTTPVDLNAIKTEIPPAAPDTFTPPKPVRRAPEIPAAPPELMQVVEREQLFSKFCYQERGQKVDPSLRGGVAMVVTVGPSEITEAKVVDDTWSSKAGKAVNECLNEKAATAWKPAPGEVKPGKYVVQLSFRPS